MTVHLNSTIERHVISGTGPYRFSFRIFAATDLTVTALSSTTPPVSVILTHLTHYTVSGVNDRDGGSIELTSGAASVFAGYTLDIRSNTPNEQPTSLRNLGRSPAEIHEDAIDNLARQIQDLRRRVDAAFRYPDNGLNDGALTPLSAWLSKYLTISASGVLEPAALSDRAITPSIITDLLSASPAQQHALLALLINRLDSLKRTDTEIAAGVTPTNYAYPAGHLWRLGGSPSASAATNDAAFVAANATAAARGGLMYIDLPAGDYVVTTLPTFTAGVRLKGEGRIVTSTTHRRTWEYGGEAATASDRTYYVNAASGNDANTGLASNAAFKTLQRAWNQLPPLIMHKITISIAEGTYNTQELAAADMPRAAMLWLTGKVVRARTDESGADGVRTTGYVLFQGTSKARTIIETQGDYKYGVYCSQVNNIGLSELTIRSGVASSERLLVAHRTGTYVQCSNVNLDGNRLQAPGGAFAEGGAVLEITGHSDISACTVGMEAAPFSAVVYANRGTIAGCKTGINISGGLAHLAGPVTCSSPINGQGGELLCEGSNATDRVTLSGAITLVNIDMIALWTNIGGAIDAFGSRLYFNTVGYSSDIEMYGGELRLQAADSFISPATASAVSTPVSLYQDASFFKDPSSRIVGAGGRRNAVQKDINVTISSNGTSIPVVGGAGRRIYAIINGGGRERTNCTLPATDATCGGEWIEGQELILISTSADTVQIIDSTTAAIVSGSVTVGAGSGSYRAVTFKWLLGRWREISRSLVTP